MKKKYVSTTMYILLKIVFCFFFSLLQLAIDYHRAKSDMRQRRASESDSILDKEESTPKNVDILQMLSKAQHEYDRVTPNTIEMLTGVEGKICFSESLLNQM